MRPSHTLYTHHDADHGEVCPYKGVLVVKDVGLTQCILSLLQLSQSVAGHTHSKPGQAGGGLLAGLEESAPSLRVLGI